MYRSTRSDAAPVAPENAILDGLAPDGGLYVPCDMPSLPPRVLDPRPLDYPELAGLILRPFLPGFDPSAIETALKTQAGLFSRPEVTPLVQAGGLRFLELFHGPTLAFKDLALTVMGPLIKLAAGRLGSEEEIVILVATSGDTGKAALAGFASTPGVRVIVFYPAEGVSPIQRLQMVCHDAGRASVLGIRGNFDEAQRGVKAIFASPAAAAALSARGMRLSSANSINIARLLPQIVYYAAAWRSLRASGALGKDDAMDVVVPTGNFGNILAAWYAKRMGLPIGTLVCAANRNRVLADFFASYAYDSRRPFYATTSPSMDILVSSNLERLVFHATGEDPSRTAELMGDLGREGRYSLAGSERAALGDFEGGWADEADAGAATREIFNDGGYLLDPHTAVAAAVARARRGSARATVVVATASPFKFPAAVAEALGLRPRGGPGAEATDELDLAARLADLAGTVLPDAIFGLRHKPEIHTRIVDPGAMESALLETLGAV